MKWVWRVSGALVFGAVCFVAGLARGWDEDPHVGEVDAEAFNAFQEAASRELGGARFGTINDALCDDRSAVRWDCVRIFSAGAGEPVVIVRAQVTIKDGRAIVGPFTRYEPDGQ